MPKEMGHNAYISVGAVVGKNEGKILNLNTSLNCVVYPDIFNGSFDIGGDICDNDSCFYIGRICGTNPGEITKVVDVGSLTATTKIGRDWACGSIDAYQYVGDIFGRNFLGNI